MIDAVHYIVQAEHAKEVWKHRDHETKERYRQLAIASIEAAKLARKLTIWFPPPWDTPSAASMGPFITHLVEFAVCGLYETSVVDRDVSTRLARAMLDRLHADLQADGKSVSDALVGQLAWLALGRLETV